MRGQRIGEATQVRTVSDVPPSGLQRAMHKSTRSQVGRCPGQCQQHQGPSLRREPPVDQVGDAETMEDMLDALAFPLTDDAAEGWCWNPFPESSHSHSDVELLEDGEALAIGIISDTESVAVQERGSEVGEDETFALASVPDPLVMAVAEQKTQTGQEKQTTKLKPTNGTKKTNARDKKKRHRNKAND